MKTEEIRELSDDEMKAELERLYKEAFTLRMQKASDLLPQTHLLINAKKDIARVRTIMRERQIG
ncbi:MAG: 50S ribosomal protein L29 [Gammaproteobacteria bacterium]|nr:50S ribosomal protein L29 [Gammaproteobacteria bacterium]